MKANLILFFLIAWTSITFSQSPFFLSCKTNLLKQGKAVLYAHPNFSYTSNNDTVLIDNWSFSFNGYIKYPEMRRIELLEVQHITEPFFIDFGSQQIIVDSSNELHDRLDFGSGVIVFGSKTNDEYFNNYLSKFFAVNNKREKYYQFLNGCDSIEDTQLENTCIIKSDSIKTEIKLMRDSILFNYSEVHPDSKIIPWLIYDALYYNGYQSLFQEAFKKSQKNYPDNLIQCIDSFISKSKLTAVGSEFPLLGFINSSLKNNYVESNKFTLVDFWFTKCRPCIAQFDKLKAVYQKNKNNGFDMIAISVDKEKDVSTYQKMIKQHAYPWKQILDIEGVKSSEINIKKIPSNFLLNNNGIIIAIDISPVILDDFLEKNLNK